MSADDSADILAKAVGPLLNRPFPERYGIRSPSVRPTSPCPYYGLLSVDLLRSAIATLPGSGLRRGYVSACIPK
jgi:hypothetical protein